MISFRKSSIILLNHENCTSPQLVASVNETTLTIRLFSVSVTPVPGPTYPLTQVTLGKLSLRIRLGSAYPG